MHQLFSLQLEINSWISDHCSGSFWFCWFLKKIFFLCYLFSESFLKLQFPRVGVTSFCIVNVCFKFSISGILFSD